jgi:hypothetical protein
MHLNVTRWSVSLAVSCMTASVLAAQQPIPATPQPTPDQSPSVTATGCLKQEKDVPGGRPNVAERAGVGEDFILVNAKVTRGSAGAASASPTGKGLTFKVEGLDDEKLRALLNQQVEVQGRLGMVGSATPAPTPGQPPAERGVRTPPDEVQEIRATTIKSIAASCAKSSS